MTRLDPPVVGDASAPMQPSQDEEAGDSAHAPVRRCGARRLRGLLLGFVWLGVSALALAALILLLMDFQPIEKQGADLFQTVSVQLESRGQRETHDSLTSLFASGSAFNAGGELRLEPGQRLRARLPGPFPSHWLLVEARLRGQQEEGASGQLGYLAVVGLSDSGKRLYTHRVLACRVYGGDDWHQCSASIQMDERASSALVVFTHSGDSGSLGLTQLRIHPAAEKIGFRWIQLAIGLLWLAMLAGLFRPLVTSHLGLLGLLVVVTVVVNSAMPLNSLHLLLGDLRDALVQGSGAILHSDLPADPAVAGEGADQRLAQWQQRLPVNLMQKSGHFLAFLLLGLLVALHALRIRSGQLRCDILLYLLWGSRLLLFAGATEITQMASLSRNPSIADFLLNTQGAISGVMLALLLFGLWAATRRLWRLART